MKILSKYTSLIDLINDVDNYAKLLEFIDYLPGHFGIQTLDSKIVLMNKVALQAAEVKLDDAVGNNYQCFRSKIVELKDHYLQQDKQTVANNTNTINITWQQSGCKQDWQLLYGEKSLIKNNEKVTGIIVNCTDITRLFLGPLQRFFLESETKKYVSFKNQFVLNITDYPGKYKLTNRQAELLFFLIHGKTNKEIAERLVLSARTVESHIDQIKRKYNCTTKSKLIEYCISQNYLGIMPKIIYQYINHLYVRR